MDDEGRCESHYWHCQSAKAVSKFKGWHHLVENLYKVGGNKSPLARVEAFLWRGNVAAAIAESDGLSHSQVDNFIAYLRSSSLRQFLITDSFKLKKLVQLVLVQLSLR